MRLDLGWRYNRLKGSRLNEHYSHCSHYSHYSRRSRHHFFYQDDYLHHACERFHWLAWSVALSVGGLVGLTEEKVARKKSRRVKKQSGTLVDSSVVELEDVPKEVMTRRKS